MATTRQKRVREDKKGGVCDGPGVPARDRDRGSRQRPPLMAVAKSCRQSRGMASPRCLLTAGFHCLGVVLARRTLVKHRMRELGRAGEHWGELSL